MQALSEEAGKILNSIQKMTSKDLEAELPILELMKPVPVSLKCF